MHIALDFDKTLIDIHTYNNWRLSVNELKKHVRPVFVRLIHQWKLRGFDVTIVTFSSQEKLIKCLLKEVFPEFSINVLYGMPKNLVSGKCEHLYKLSGDVILIDDDINNVNIAKKNFFKAIHFDENNLSEIFNF